MTIESFSAATALLSGLLLGCSGAPVHDARAEEEAIQVMYDHRLELLQSGTSVEEKVAAYMAVVSDDVVWMPPNEPPVEGPEALEVWATEFFGSYLLEVDGWPMNVLEIGPQLAVRRFRSVGRYVPTDGSEPVPFDQKYVDHLRKKPDGGWEIVLHMWSPNDPGPHIWH